MSTAGRGLPAIDPGAKGGAAETSCARRRGGRWGAGKQAAHSHFQTSAGAIGFVWFSFKGQRCERASLLFFCFCGRCGGVRNITGGESQSCLHF